MICKLHHRYHWRLVYQMGGRCVMRWSGTGYRYLKIAADAYTDYLPLASEMAELRRRYEGGPVPVHADERYPELDHEMMRSAVETIVFSALYLESRLYDFAAHHLGDDYVEKHIDRLPWL